jgi:non-specific serine/threonine protein kinase/serine/threonine-protein kinase
MVDDKPVPKIIDFGIAKAVSQPWTDSTLFTTEQGQLVGTPEYMSPEQAEKGNQDVDTQTDVYSLGLVLYRLLAGALPFDTKELLKQGHDEIRRKIRDDEPSKPSIRFADLGGEATEIARNRQTDIASLRRLLKRDLDWITMKALEKDPARRYATASDFAADIGRYLRAEPVLAGPPGMVYCLGKLVRRYRGLIMAGLGTAVLVASVWGLSLLLSRGSPEPRQLGSTRPVTSLAGWEMASLSGPQRPAARPSWSVSVRLMTAHHAGRPMDTSWPFGRVAVGRAASTWSRCSVALRKSWWRPIFLSQRESCWR